MQDPKQRGRRVAELFAAATPRLFTDLEEAAVFPGGDERIRSIARREWECFALYACVRGLVATGGFNRETALAIETLHEAVLGDWKPDAHGGETNLERRGLISDRYSEYGEIGQAGGKSGADTVTERLGMAAARHMVEGGSPPPGLIEMVGALHESLAESVAKWLEGGT